MMRRAARIAVTAAALIMPHAAAAQACPSEEGTLLFHSCHGRATAEILLLPEEAGELEMPGGDDGLVVGGAYTGTDRREGGRPNPVGLFVDGGRVISPNLARMDGILIIGPDAQPRLYHATRVPLGGGTTDLTDPDRRHDFAEAAARQGRSVLQSHLLITDGIVDVRPRSDAPKARRRLLFIGPGGWGVYQTAHPVTLFEAATEVQRQFRPEMALNLDMGSFDYCIETRAGVATNCGVLSASQTDKLSNLLQFTRPRS